MVDTLTVDHKGEYKDHKLTGSLGTYKYNHFPKVTVIIQNVLNLGGCDSRIVTSKLAKVTGNQEKRLLRICTHPRCEPHVP